MLELGDLEQLAAGPNSEVEDMDQGEEEKPAADAHAQAGDGGGSGGDGGAGEEPIEEVMTDGAKEAVAVAAQSPGGAGAVAAAAGAVAYDKDGNYPPPRGKSCTCCKQPATKPYHPKV